MMTWGSTAAEVVEVGSLTIGARFQVAGDGNRRGTILRITDLFVIVAYDRAGQEQREPIGVALTLRVVPL